jgi:hypothetical protein
MNETAKTLTFLAVAAAIVVTAVVARPSLPIAKPVDVRNQPLYPEFKDPLSVTGLEIVEFDEHRGEVIPFQVAQVNVKGKTRWSIPSHQDYPADAKDQVASAAAGLIGLNIIEMVSDNQGDQREYGVVDPDPKTLKVGDTGVGTRVVMRNKEGKDQLALIIGKEVPDRPGLRYVRKVGQSPIYIVNAKTDKLSTKFENWIERNLLQINSLDMKRLWVRDYAVDVMNSAVVQRGETLLEYNDTAEPKWKMVEDQKFVPNKDNPDEGKWAAVKMSADEELNAANLDALKTALDDLKIVDVCRKPAGLSSDLKAEADFMTKHEAIASLQRMGFYPTKLSSGEIELFSNEGEIRVLMKDGVEYILRFGQIAGGASQQEDKLNGKSKKDAKATEAKKNGGLNRYLFVMAEFDPDMISKPQLERLPDAKKSAEKKPEGKKPDEKKASEKKADEKKTAGKKDGKQAEDKKVAADPERERIEKENKRKQEEYEQKITDSKKHVAELNARFADWYYVISDDVYGKIHLGRDGIFQKKSKAKGKHDGHSHAGHDDSDELPSLPGGDADANPADVLNKLKAEGPGGK